MLEDHLLSSGFGFFHISIHIFQDIFSIFSGFKVRYSKNEASKIDRLIFNVPKKNTHLVHQ